MILYKVRLKFRFVLKETINIISSVFHCKLNRKRRSKLNRLCSTVVAPTALILSTIIRKANSFGNIVKIQNIMFFSRALSITIVMTENI